MTDAGARFHGLPQVVIERLQAAEAALQQRDFGRAIEAARAALQSAPDHPEVLHCLARALSARGASAEALALIQRAAAALPDDAPTINTLAVILDVNGQRDAAVSAFRRASDLAPESADVAYNFGRILSHVGRLEESQQELERALALNPAQRMARAALVEVLRQRGCTADAVAQCRRLLNDNPADFKAWSALAGISQHRFDAGEIAAMERVAGDPALGLEGRVRLGFALGRAYEDAGRHAAAFAAYRDANAAIRAQRPWDAAAHSAEVDAILAAFPRAEPVDDPQRGSDVIFLVSLPRAGSTLVEQILASHPQVEGGDERMDLLNVIAEEGQRRRQPLSRWAAQAGAGDWRRLGERYLERSARWRSGKPILTDKLPGNWLWLGAAMAMLPGARVVECRRDPLETAWSCFCQIFADGAQQFSYDFASIGSFFRDYERSMRHWRTLYPARIYTQTHEALLEDFDAQVRALLGSCGLTFDPACLEFHETRRNIRTISSTQVREPLRRDTARAARCGPLLDPLRAALGLAAYSAHG
ncbi:MAG TPA: sulfotransferase [Rudaea sp.]|nr:sulfotransferase [Rudaea sp.]